MAKKKKSGETLVPITPSRAVRLLQFVTLLGQSPQSRDQLTKQLKLGLRDFYRDMELLRKVGIAITHESGQYKLSMSQENALSQLPFPDPFLTMGDAEKLAKGKTAAHTRLKEKLDEFKSAGEAKSKSRKKS